MNYSNEHLTRQADLIPTSVLGEKITIIGAGAIGSWTTLALAKMGFSNLTVYDFDYVDTVNLNSQFFTIDDARAGSPKVSALRRMVEEFTGVYIETKMERYERGTFPGIVISAVDSMTARKLIWENHKNKAFGTRAIIDPRMGAETALLFVMNPMDAQDQKAYGDSLYSDDEAVQERCTAKATIYTANMLSGLVCKAVKDLVTTDNYLRTAQWNIQDNAFEGFRRNTK